jgi:hypothetical protein
MRQDAGEGALRSKFLESGFESVVLSNAVFYQAVFTSLNRRHESLLRRDPPILIQVRNRIKHVLRKFQIGKEMANVGHCTKKTFSGSLPI